MESSQNASQERNQTSDEEVLSASGTTAIGTYYETFSLDFIDTKLMIEEVYLTVDDQTNVGTKFLKLTDDSISGAKKELENELKDAQVSFDTAKITYDLQMLSAKNDYDNSIAAGNNAQSVYENTLADLNKSITDAADAVRECNEKTAEYNNALLNHIYYTDNDVEGKLNIYEEDQALLSERQNILSNVEAQLLSNSQDADLLAKQASLQTEIAALETAVATAKSSYESAVKSYEDQESKARSKIVELDSSYSNLVKRLNNAKLSYEQKSVEAKKNYELTMDDYNNAETIYQTTIQKLELDMQSLTDSLTEAQKHLDQFNQILGDGYYYTTNAGIISAVGVQAEGILSAGTDNYLLAYDDADRITVSVSIGQSDIATLAVGDSCHVTLSSHENYSGLITQITPISSSTSRSSVSYTVVVSVQGDVSQVTAGSTAELVFSQADEDSQELDDTNASDSDIPAFEGQSTMENNGL